MSMHAALHYVRTTAAGFDVFEAQAPGSELPPARIYWFGGLVFQFAAEYTVHDVLHARWFTIPEGFQFNGASAPRIVWSLVSPLDLGPIAAGCHDYLHSRLSLQDPVAARYTRSQSNALFADHMKLEAVPAWRRVPAYRAVRWFGSPYWRNA